MKAKKKLQKVMVSLLVACGVMVSIIPIMAEETVT